MKIVDFVKYVLSTNATIGRLTMEECGIADGQEVCCVVAIGEDAAALKKWHEERHAD